MWWNSSKAAMISCRAKKNTIQLKYDIKTHYIFVFTQVCGCNFPDVAVTLEKVRTGYWRSRQGIITEHECCSWSPKTVLCSWSLRLWTTDHTAKQGSSSLLWLQQVPCKYIITPQLFSFLHILVVLHRFTVRTFVSLQPIWCTCAEMTHKLEPVS